MEPDSIDDPQRAPGDVPTLNGIMLIPRLCYLVGRALHAADLHCLECTSWWNMAELRWQVPGWSPPVTSASSRSSSAPGDVPTLNGILLIPRLCYLVGRALHAADLHCLECTSWWNMAELRWQVSWVVAASHISLIEVLVCTR